MKCSFCFLFKKSFETTVTTWTQERRWNATRDASVETEVVQDTVFCGIWLTDGQSGGRELPCSSRKRSPPLLRVPAPGLLRGYWGAIHEGFISLEENERATETTRPSEPMDSTEIIFRRKYGFFDQWQRLCTGYYRSPYQLLIPRTNGARHYLPGWRTDLTNQRKRLDDVLQGDGETGTSEAFASFDVLHFLSFSFFWKY